MSGWPDAHIELLKKLHKDGLSASQISKSLSLELRDASYSRNAVIGKVHRLGLGPIGGGRPSAPGARAAVARASAVRNAAREPRTFAPGVFVLPPANRQPEPQPPRVVVDKAAAFSPLPGAVPVPFMERPWNACAWPVSGSGADMLCCGLEVEDNDGPRHCPTHRAMALNRHIKRKSPNELMRALRRFAA